MNICTPGPQDRVDQKGEKVRVGQHRTVSGHQALKQFKHSSQGSTLKKQKLLSETFEIEISPIPDSG